MVSIPLNKIPYNMNFKVVSAFVVVIGLACSNQAGKKEITLPVVADNLIVGIVNGKFGQLYISWD